MNIDSIQNGYVLDHIQAGHSIDIVRLLGLDKLDCSVAIIRNAKSTKMVRKDIIKIDELIDLNLDILGYVDPDITVSVIEGGEQVKKMHPPMPKRLVNVLRCKNPRCITTVEAGLDSEFILTDPEHRTYCCAYCDAEYRRP
ncbi:MAG: aspartate carbamoyltransferase regulatory subunit [Oscillospiraceae bacterium]